MRKKLVAGLLILALAVSSLPGRTVLAEEEKTEAAEAEEPEEQTEEDPGAGIREEAVPEEAAPGTEAGQQEEAGDAEEEETVTEEPQEASGEEFPIEDLEEGSAAEERSLMAAASEISSVSITLNKRPRAGENQSLKPSLTVTGTGIDGHRAFYQSFHGYSTIEDEFTFEEGKTYYICVDIDAEDGYTFKKGESSNGIDPGWKFGGNVSVSGETASFLSAVATSYSDAGTLVVWISVQAAPGIAQDEDIGQVTLNFTPPEAGQKGSEVTVGECSSLTSDSHCEIFGGTWYEDRPDADPSAEPAREFTGTFEGGKTYYAEVYMEPQNGYKLRQASPVTGLTVNGAQSFYDLLYVINSWTEEHGYEQTGIAFISFTVEKPDYETGYTDDEWIDETVDKSFSNVKAYVHLTGDCAYQTPYDPEMEVFSEKADVEFSTPRTGEVNQLIGRAMDTALALASGYTEKARGRYRLEGLPKESTDRVWDHRIYFSGEARVIDGPGIDEAIEALYVEDDVYEDKNGNRYTPDDYRITRIHRAYGEYGKETTYTIRVTGEVPGYKITVTDDGNGSGEADAAAAIAGEIISLQAEAKPGYRFREWKVLEGGADLTDAADPEASFEMPMADLKIMAVFESSHSHSLIHRDKVDATCEKDGTEEYWECEECRKLFSDEEGTKEIKAPVKIKKTGHAWDEGVVTKEPTCTEKGEKTFTCQNDPEHTRIKEIKALGHDWGEWEITKEATEEEAGTKVRTCKNDPSHTETREYTLKKDEPEKEKSGGSKKESSSKAQEKPKTGDSAAAPFWVLLLGASLSGGLLALLAGKKKSRR